MSFEILTEQDVIHMETSDFHRFYEMREKEGTIINRSSSRRVLIMDAEGLLSMTSELVKLFSSGTYMILFNAGKIYGKSMLQAHGFKNADVGDVMKYFADLARVSGWGWVRFHFENNPSNSARKLIIESSNLLVAEGSTETNPSCYFVKGLLQGIAEDVLGKQSEIEETSCRSTGKSDVCRFEISY
jgi:predicted hydrocarbon binding protein